MRVQCWRGSRMPRRTLRVCVSGPGAGVGGDGMTGAISVTQWLTGGCCRGSAHGNFPSPLRPLRDKQRNLFRIVDLIFLRFIWRTCNLAYYLSLYNQNIYRLKCWNRPRRGRISIVCLRWGTIKQECPKLNLIEVKIQKNQDKRVDGHQTNFVFFIRTVFFLWVKCYHSKMPETQSWESQLGGWAGSCWGSGCQRLLESLFWPSLHSNKT